MRRTLCQLGLALVVSTLAACGDDGEGRARPTPTVTRTATPTDTVTPHGTPTPTATDTPTPSPTPLPLTSTDVAQRGALGVGVTTIVFEDTSRPTMANGSFPGSATRRLVTEVWYPTAPSANEPPAGRRDAPFATGGAPYPLVIHSHGFMDTRNGGAYLARHLATHGYVVAAPDFPLTNFGAPGGPNFFDIANQPGDVSFLITRLLAHATFGPGIDAARIGLTGLSLGGSTTLLATFHRTLGDARVRAAATFAAGTCFFNETFYRFAEVPLLILHGDIDAIVAYEEHAVFGYDQARAPKYLVTLADASHTGFAEIAAALFEETNNPDQIGCDALGDGAGTGTEPADLLDLLGGKEAGVFLGNCPESCPDPPPLPRAMRPSRQHRLTVLSTFPFLEAYLRDRADMRQFLETALAAENADATVAFER
jgi:predicted dienelactone hydrolase